MGSTPEFRKAFVARLIQACDESRLIPAQGRGRQNFIANRMGLAPEAISKWFKGISMPRPDKMESLANLLEVDQSWLAFGIQPEMNRTQRRVHAKESDGAVHLVWGMISLAGGHCGEPSKTDPRGEYVDFYATLRGSVFPIHVALGREVSKDRFELLLPKEYPDVRSIGVLPAGPGRFHYIDLPLSLVNEHKQRKSGAVSIQANRVERDKYMTGSTPWPRIRSFQELGMSASLMECPWVSVREVCRMYGVTYETARNKIHEGTFDVPTYKVGKLWVIDREVHEEYFRRLRAEGLAKLSTRG